LLCPRQGKGIRKNYRANDALEESICNLDFRAKDYRVRGIRWE